MLSNMTEHGAALQTYNQELVKCLEDLKYKRNEIVDIIYKEEAEKVILEKKLETLQNRLSHLNKTLEHHKCIYESYDKTIKDTEDGFRKVCRNYVQGVPKLMEQRERVDSLYQDNAIKLNLP